MKINFCCYGEIAIPNKILPVLLTCNKCNKRYMIKKGGIIEEIDEEPLLRRFLAMHY